MATAPIQFLANETIFFNDQAIKNRHESIIIAFFKKFQVLVLFQTIDQLRSI